MVCTSLGSLLGPLFYFLCSNLKANPVHSFPDFLSIFYKSATLAADGGLDNIPVCDCTPPFMIDVYTDTLSDTDATTANTALSRGQSTY